MDVILEPIEVMQTTTGTSGRLAVWMSWVLQIIVALILGQTLFFKFTGAEESVYIFSQLGAEPWGRFGSGLAELLAILLLLTPQTVVLGSMLALVVMCGAIFAHLTTLGIVVHDDGGLLFALAVAVFLSSAVILCIRHHEWLPLLRRLAAK